MKFVFLLVLVFICPPPKVQQETAEPEAALPWFTDADIPNAVSIARPAEAIAPAPGTEGKGVRLTQAFVLEHPLLDRESGMISFWIQPNWNGNDGQTHRILWIGDPDQNGLAIEKAASGMLRFVMASPTKITSSRADVSHWGSGEWHHVAIVWMSRDGRPLGLPLWIDRKACAGPVAGGNTFLDPKAMPDPRLWIGGETSQAVMDELILRKKLSTDLSRDQVQLVYRDSFLTAPYTQIAIDPEPLRVPADKRVVNGHCKQFGLKAGSSDWMEPVTDYAVRYGQWAEFDAKPFIQWETTNPNVAVVDGSGMVTGKSPGTCELIAKFRGLEAKYSLEVIPADQPDLDLLCVSRLPRYPWDRAKSNPDPGERVESEALVENFGFQPVAEGAVVRFELIPDANRNFRLDPQENATVTEEKVIEKPLEPRGQHRAVFSWAWTNDPLWVRVTVDPENKVSELCEANNQRCELNIARPMRWGFNPKVLKSCFDEKKVNHVGSFSFYDWINGQAERLRVMMREAVWPTTSPEGIRDDIRTDNFYELKLGRWEDEPYEKEEKFYDGGFPINEPVNLMAVDSAILHEFGHTCLALPDLYGYPVPKSSVLLRDEEDRLYAGSELLPAISGDTLPLPSSNNVPCGVGYNSLMNFCHLWLHPVHAGQVHHFAGFRGPRFWGVQGRLIPTREHVLQIYDVNDQPLANAGVYTYHVTQTAARDASTKYFYDQPKFMGLTDQDGRYFYPDCTDRDWDDPDTDEVEGEYEAWNPFARAHRKGHRSSDVAFTPNVWEVQGLLLLKIVSGDQTEFAWLPLTEFNEAYFRGERIRGLYEVRTSLQPSEKPTLLVRREIPEAIRQINLKPVAVAPNELVVRCGEEFTIDGTGSRDPENQPLIYRWTLREGHAEPRQWEEAVYKGVAPKDPGELEFCFFVIDGLRVSDPVSVRVHLEAAEDRVILPISRTQPMEWRYTVEKPGDDWFVPGFDDSNWKKGVSGFGAGGAPGSIVGTNWDTAHIWLRREVNLPDPLPKRPSFLLYHDEDVEIFVNGVLAAQEPGYRTVYRIVSMKPEALQALKPGENLIAVHCMNTGGAQYIDVGIVLLD